jgi:hypothetical protein
MDCRISDIEIIYNKLVENFINKINIDNKDYDSYKHYKINKVKMILYNNHDKITNDISLMLTTTDEILEKYKPELI